MAADVGISIEDYEVVATAEQDEILLVIGRIVLRFTENASAFKFFRAGAGDVFVPPGAPKSIHNQLRLAAILMAAR